MLGEMGSVATGIADSSLISGLIGAGSVALGGLLANRRADRIRAEDGIAKEKELAEQRAREDLAAWREQRHDLYVEWLDAAGRCFEMSSRMVASCRRIETTSESARDYVQLRLAVEERLKQLQAGRGKMALMASSAMLDSAYQVWTFCDVTLQSLPVMKPPAPTVQEQAEEFIVNGRMHLEILRAAMLKQLGLPEDE